MIKKAKDLLNDCHYEPAFELLDQIIASDPKNIEALITKAINQQTIGNNEEAIESYDKVIEADPKYISAYTKKATILVDMDKDEEAIDCYDCAIKL